MEILDKIISLNLWGLYAYFEGMREAYYYHLISASSFIRKNIHWIYFIQRGFILVLIGTLTNSLFLPLSLACIFPFIHDGSYYITYNKLSPGTYKKGFMDSSTTSTAFLEFNWNKRIVLLILGILFYLIDLSLYFITI